MAEDSFDIHIDAADGTRLFGARMEAPSPRARLLIIHGMSEHFGRYEHFASFLADKGISVYGFDLRGHGRTGEETGTPGFLGEEGGWNLVVEDIDLWVDLLRQKKPELPIFLLGHSMGSFLSRAYAAQQGEKLAGLILSGTGRDPGLTARLGAVIAALEGRIKGSNTPSVLLDRLSFGPYARSVKNRVTRFDWLSRDAEQVDQYIADPLCGRVSTNGFFSDLLQGIREVHRPELIRRTPRDLPIYFFSGSRDPVGGFSRGVAHVYKEYSKAGNENISLKIYSDGRHEMLNETNRDEVYRDVLQWLEFRLPPAEGEGAGTGL